MGTTITDSIRRLFIAFLMLAAVALPVQVLAQSGTYAYVADSVGDARSTFYIGNSSQAIGLKVGVLGMPPESSNPVFDLRIYRPDGTVAAQWSPHASQYGSWGQSGVSNWFWRLGGTLNMTGTWKYYADVNGVEVADVSFTVIHPVILVHGLWSGPGVWKMLLAQMQSTEFLADALNFQTTPQTQRNKWGPTEAPIEDQAAAIASEVTYLVTDSSGIVDVNQTVDLVCHSAGGLAARYYLEHPELWPIDSVTQQPGACVGRLITLGTPHWGTDVMIANPVATICVARDEPFVGCPDSVQNTDSITSWSPALTEMFSEWCPPPSGNVTPPNGYPANWCSQLDEWPGAKKYLSPISEISLYIAKTFRAYPSSSAKSAVAAAVDKFGSLDASELFVAHQSYYNEFLDGSDVIEWPSPGVGIIGVSSRYVSFFLFDLNSSESLNNFVNSGATLYVLGGEDNDLFSALGFPIVQGPWNASRIPNDGAVPVDSALGIDPLSGAALLPNIRATVLLANHSTLPSYPDSIEQILSWLRDGGS